jgi:starch synthase
LENVWFANGWLHDRGMLRRYLSAADLYVFPSRFEGYPNALLEAMACGLPVVAADIAGVPDIVGRDGAAAGILVQPNDSAALADAITKLLDDHALRTRYADHAPLRVDDRFSPRVVGTRIRDFMIARGMRSR